MFFIGFCYGANALTWRIMKKTSCKNEFQSNMFFAASCIVVKQLWLIKLLWKKQQLFRHPHTMSSFNILDLILWFSVYHFNVRNFRLDHKLFFVHSYWFFKQNVSRSLDYRISDGCVYMLVLVNVLRILLQFPSSKYD